MREGSGEWSCSVLWLLHVSSKAHLIVIVAGLGHALNGSRGPILLPSLCLSDRFWPRHSASLILGFSKS